MRRVSFSVNGSRHELELEPRELLVYVLRERLGLTGTNVGCDTSSCGACTILLDGESVKSCTVLGVQADGREITTIEGLARDGALHPVQQAFSTHHALQCGYCTPGFVMATLSLLAENPSPTEDEIRHGLEGNLCRCTGYHNIVKAVQYAAKKMADSEQEIREWLEGNICRCTGYHNIVKSIAAGAKAMTGGAS